MKLLKTLVLLCLPLLSFSQNIQLHYDLGKAKDDQQQLNRNYFTATVEFFKPDKLGSTFFFVDFDFDKGNGGTSLAYFEIARKFNLSKKNKLSLQLEYNDGSPNFLKSAFLTGLSYPIKIGKVVLNTSLLYKQFNGASGPDAQLTIVWHHSLIKDKLLFCGFLDVWSQDKFASSDKQLVILSEPQFWFKLNPNLSLGSEIEISKNFFTFDGNVEIMPTIALKWNL